MGFERRSNLLFRCSALKLLEDRGAQREGIRGNAGRKREILAETLFGLTPLRYGTPWAAMLVPNVCRRSWKRRSRTPARRSAALKRLSSRDRSIGLPVWGWANTRSSSVPYGVSWCS